MKKTLLLALLAACGVGFVNAEVRIVFTNVDQPAGDTLLYAMPVSPEHFQDIQNYPSNKPASIVAMFQPEYLVTKQDFSNGDTQLGTATLPCHGKVVGLALQGYDNGSEPGNSPLFLEATAWCRNTSETAHQHIAITDGYNSYAPQGDLFTDTVHYRNFNGVGWNELTGSTLQGSPGYVFEFEDGDSLNPGDVVNLPFNNPEVMSDDPQAPFPPFWYKGENIVLTLWMNNFLWYPLKYRYMTYDEAETEIASIFRTGNICFNNSTLPMIKSYLGMDLMYDLPKHSLPAFRIPYYTNDIRIVGENTEHCYLVDEDGNRYDQVDGEFENLDHTKTYYIVVDGEVQPGEIRFDNIYKDIEVTVEGATAVEDINTNKAVASVRYYNLAGQESAEAMSGVNIVVTTYADGTTSTAKVVK